MLNDDFTGIIYSTICFLSITSIITVLCLLKKDRSFYTSLLKVISLFELSFIFSKFYYIVNYGNNESNDTNKTSETNITNDTNITNITNIIKIINKTDNTNNTGNVDNIFKTINYFKFTIFNITTFNCFNVTASFLKDIDIAFLSSMQNSYICLNILFCVETINFIKRPFTQTKNKIPQYYLISLIIAIISFILNYLFNKKILDLIILSLYIIFIFLGICSIIILIRRFCLNKPLIQGSKNIFIIRHFTYILIFSLFFIVEIDLIFDYFFKKHFSVNEEEEEKIILFIRNIIILSIGIVMSLIKISDKICCCFNDKSKSKNKGLTSSISSNLNTEFMCCILYGLTDIFKNYNKNVTIDNEIGKKTHTIKYLNYVTGKKSSEINNIQMEVSEFKKDDLSDNISYKSNKTDKINKVDESFNNDEKDALIIEYSNNIFAELREKDGISNDVIIKSFSPIKNKNAIAKMSESKGRSGSFFFYSHDRKFIIKTITSSELKTFLNTLKDYYSYINNNKNSLITKIYGIYSIVIASASSISIILMQNLFFCSPVHIQKMFDLKGSSIQRITKNVKNWKRDQVLKDLDYQWVTKVERKLVSFKKNDISEILNNLNHDINFFKRMRLMDYSLLFIIIEFPSSMDPDYNQIISLLDDPKYIGHVYKSTNMQQIYIVGIIDYLQKYDIKKKFEHLFKAILYTKERNMISAVEPDYYSKRFYDFMEKNVFIEGEKASD